MIPASDLEHEGRLVSHTHTSYGVEFEEFFCRNCFTRIFNTNSAMLGTIFLRAGTLDASDSLTPHVHIWTKRKQSWVILPPTVYSFRESPTPDQFHDAFAASDDE